MTIKPTKWCKSRRSDTLGLPHRDWGIGLLTTWPRAVVLIGFGCDEEHPLRPWPKFTRGPGRWCLSVLGLFLNVRNR